MRTYTEKQVQTLLANEILAVVSQPTYETQFTEALKKALIERGVNFNNVLEADISAAVAFIREAK